MSRSEEPVLHPATSRPSADHIRAIQRGLASSTNAVREALAKLFDPSPVHLGPMEPMSVPSLLADETEIHVVAFEVLGPVRAQLSLLTGQRAGSLLAGALLRRHAGEAPGDEGRAALVELGNIVASSFLNGLAYAADLRLVLSVPALGQSLDDAASFSARVQNAFRLAAPFEVRLPSGPVRGAVVAAGDPMSVGPLLNALSRSVRPDR